MKHLILALMEAAVALGILLSFAHYGPVRVEQVTHSIAASKHAWQDLTDAEKVQLADLAKRDFPKGIKIDIVCNDAGCSDLAADLDDAFEDAGIESSLDKAIGPLGYGIGVAAGKFDENAAEVLINVISASTGLQPAMTSNKSAPGYVTILIGKKPR